MPQEYLVLSRIRRKKTKNIYPTQTQAIGSVRIDTAR